MYSFNFFLSSNPTPQFFSILFHLQGSGATKHLDWAALFTSIGVVITAVAFGLYVSAHAVEKVQER